MCPQPSQPSPFLIFHPLFGIVEISQPPNHRHVSWAFAGFGLLGAAVGTTGLAYLSPSLLSLILSTIVVAYLIFRRLKPDWILPLRHSAELWAIGRLYRWYIARCCGYFRPCVHHIFEYYKISQIDLHCRGLNVFCQHVCCANHSARQLRNIDPPSDRLGRYWHRLDLFGHAL